MKRRILKADYSKETCLCGAVVSYFWCFLFLLDAFDIFDGACVKSVCIKLSRRASQFPDALPGGETGPVISEYWASQDMIAFLGGEGFVSL